MKTLLTLAVALLLTWSPLPAAEPATAQLFTSFRGNGDGLHLAYSLDGRDWTDLGRVFLKPAVGAKLMRDPHILHGPDGLYHMVWTSGWSDAGIGYASSKNLTEWSEQKFLPLMAKVPNTKTCWAPELYYDPESSNYIIVWSSNVPAPGSKEEHHRAYYTLTRDFTTFTEPKILFDPGFNNIDTTMLRVDGRYVIVFKETDDQPGGKWGTIYAAAADKPHGPYTLLPDPPLVKQRAEGPAPVAIGGKTLLYVDFYANHRYGVYETADWKTWADVTATTSVIPGQRHGSILTIPAGLLAELRAEEQKAIASVPRPILDGFTADPAIRVFGDTYYVYPTSDKPNWMTTDFSVWSSKNLIDWKNEGMILDVTKDLSWAKIRAWAPDCIERNGTYYFYFCAEQQIGVATADKPTGPFKDALGRPLIQKGGKVTVGQAIDPHAFIDDDGQAYLYYGNGAYAQVFKLKPDMITLDGDPVDIRLRDFREGIVVFKRNGKYYFMWSIDDARSPNYRVGWGTADTPFGPVTSPQDGFIVLQKNGAATGTAHHSVVNVPGTDRWYVAYHRHAVPGGSGYKRQTCLVRMEFNPDGTIKPMDPLSNPFPQGVVGEPIGAGIQAGTPAAQAANQPLQGSLKDSARNLFDIGVGIHDRIADRTEDHRLLLAQFSMVTAENCMKPAAIQPAEGKWNFTQADAFVEFATKNGLKVVGHCLIWAKDDRTPAWFFRDGEKPAGRDLILERMRQHIETEVKRYRGRIAMWDVVNEALDDGGEYLRPSGWSNAWGEEFIAKAFEYSHAADPNALLIYNDYNNELPAKREKQIRLLRSLREKKVPVHAIGLQGHYEIDRVPFKEIEDTLIAMRQLGIKVVISELDIDIIPRGRWWADGGKHREELSKLDPYRDGCPPELLQRQAEQYAQLFEIFRRYSDTIVRVSFWNLHDGQSWLNDFPWKRVNHPLLFDRQGNAKPAFGAVMSVLNRPAGASNTKLFHLEDVRLLDGPFKHAQDVNRKYILAHDADRLLAPFRREAGLPAKAKPYGNWESMGLDGHSAGHYLSALAMMHASTGDAEFKRRLDHMVAELAECQKANGDGYVGGVPRGKALWADVAAGRLKPTGFGLNDRWVPWYNIHKTYAGLRDAYVIGRNEQARQVLIGMGDWCVNLLGRLTDEQVQSMLRSEHGGMTESLADIHAITDDRKYLDAANRFSDRRILDPLIAGRDELTGKHANTQIPKVIGFERIGALTGNADMHRAATFFWENVTAKRTVSIGGNSVNEHFHAVNNFKPMIEDRTGPETCNTYNMLRLSEALFEAGPHGRLADYYERALFNHILSTQDPKSGGYVYFTPMRPRHYRVYSTAEQGFWCCVGTGFENHSRYGQFIYAHDDSALFVNLYIASELIWKKQSLTLRQETKFPDQAGSRLTLLLKQPATFTLNLRKPSWLASDDLAVKVNGKETKAPAGPAGFAAIQREWHNGDTVEIDLPMRIEAEPLPDGSKYVSLRYGPVVLAAATGAENMRGLFAGAGRGDHIAGGPLLPLHEAPTLIADDMANIAGKVKREAGEELLFTAKDSIQPAQYRDLKLIPFSRLHQSRYVIYWPVASAAEYAAKGPLADAPERDRLALEAGTIDQVTPGAQQSEVDHGFKGENTANGTFKERSWRDTRGWFSYELKVLGGQDVDLLLTFYGGDAGRRFDVLIDDAELAEISLDGSDGDRFISKRFPLAKAASGRTIVVKFAAKPGSIAGGVFDVRTVRRNPAPDAGK